MQFDVKFTPFEKLGMAGALTVVLSAFLPWVTIGLGRVSSSGLAGGYPGQFTLTLGVVALVGIVQWGWRVRTRALLATVGLASVVAVLVTLVGLTSRMNPGLGLVMTALGATALLGTGLYGLVDVRTLQRRVAT